jgi:serine/threonine protein kinase
MQPQGHRPLPAGTIVAEKFRILRPLGEGGMGSVYVVEHVITRHERALKLLHPEMASVPEVVDRFLREASAAGHIGSEHIVETFDAGTLGDGAPYLVMELLRGQTLSERLERGDLPLSELVPILEQACSGIQAAHDAGIVHRDLKPENLFITERQGRPFVKILDFGISKFDPNRSGELSVTREGAALGTPYYMSPEQILGSRAVDHRTDVYALGVVLYECLTRRKPFVADALPMLTVLIHEGRYTPIAALRPELPAVFGQIVARALQRQPEDRFQSARDLAAALGAAAHGKVPTGLALDRTALSEAPAGGSPFDASSASASASSVHAQSALRDPKLGTSALGVSIRQPEAARGSGRGLVIGGVFGVVAVVGAGLVALSLGNDRDAASSPDAMVPEAPLTARVPAATAAPEVPPAIAPPVAPVNAMPSAVAAKGGPSAVPSAAPSAKAPARSPDAAASTEKRARSHQESLATENPFR